MAPNTDTQQQLVKTTNSVAMVLSTDFGIRSKYESVNSPSRSPTSLEPVDLGRSEAATALRAFFAQQTGRDQGQSIQMLRGLAAVKVGDIVEITSGVLSPRKLLMISSCAQPRLRGVILVTAASTILHDVVASNELFITCANTAHQSHLNYWHCRPGQCQALFCLGRNQSCFYGLEAVGHAGSFEHRRECHIS